MNFYLSLPPSEGPAHGSVQIQVAAHIGTDSLRRTGEVSDRTRDCYIAVKYAADEGALVDNLY
jgi:hypothetical protein